MKEFRVKKKLGLLLITALATVALVAAFAGPVKSSVLSKTDKIFRLGESSLRVGSLGGEVGVTDSSNPLNGTSLSLGTDVFITDESPYTRFQVDNAGKVKKDSRGRSRILVTGVTKKTTAFKRNAVILKPKKTKKKPVEFVLTEPFFSEINEEHNNILVLHIDTTGDGDADKFPSYFIKSIDYKTTKLPKKYGVTITKEITNKKGKVKKKKEKIGVAGVFFTRAKLPVITTFTDIETKGDIKLIQVLETPNAFIERGKPLKVKKGWVAVGPAVTVSASTTLSETATPESLDNATLTVPYFTDVVSALGISDSDLFIFKNKGAKISSKITDTLSIDSSAGTASFSKMTDFGTYQVLGKTSGQSTSLPVISTLKTKADKKGKVKIVFSLLDADGKKSDVKIEYRKNPTVDGNAGWKTIKTLKKVKPGSKSKSYTWKSKSDIGKDAAYFQIRVTPQKNIDGNKVRGVFKTTDTFRIETAKSAPKSPRNLKVNVKNKSKNEVDANGEDTKPPQVALSWRKPSGGAAGYNVYRQARFRNGVEDTFSIIKTINGSSTTSFKDNKANGTLSTSFLEAFYAVTAFDSSGKESELSKPLSAASIVFGSYYYYG